MAIGMVGLFGASNLAYRALEPSLSSRALALEINKTLRPDDRLVLYGDLRVAPGVAFYCNRHVLLYNAAESNLVVRIPVRRRAAPKVFFSDRDFPGLWAGPDRVLLVVPAHKKEEVLKKLPPGSARVLAERGGKTAYVNRAE